MTLMAGAAAILFDPVFQGMAISLFFGAFVATVLSLTIIPIGCLVGCHAFDSERPNVPDVQASANGMPDLAPPTIV